MPTYYVEDFDNKKNADAVEREPFTPVSEEAEVVPQAKVVEAEKPKSGPSRSSRAKTKG